MKTTLVAFLCVLLSAQLLAQKTDSVDMHGAKDTSQARQKAGENVLAATTGTKTFRIDKVHDTLRFTCWMGKKTSADAPDLVLNNGSQGKSDAGGTMWTFKNGPWAYIVEDDELSGGEDSGLFLMTYRSNMQVQSERCTKSK